MKILLPARHALIAVAFLSLFPVCSSLAEESHNEVMFDRSTVGYQVDYAEGWNVRLGDPDDQIDSSFSHSEPTIEVNIIRVPSSGLKKIDEKTLQQIYNQASASFDAVELREISTTTFKDKESGFYNFSGLDPEDPTRTRVQLIQYLFLHNDSFFMITIAADHKEMDEARPVWEKFLEKIRLVE